MKYTKIPADTFEKLQMNAGVLLKNFDPNNQETIEGTILGPTTGGVLFSATADYTDFGEDIDNCPNNTKQLKKKGYTTATCNGSFVAIDADLAKRLAGGADIDPDDPSHVIPRGHLKDDDFQDVWLVGDYSAINEDGAKDGRAGFIAIHLMNTLSTDGFAIQTAKNGKGTFSFKFTAHYDMEQQDKEPYEIYIQAGKADSAE